MKFFHSMQFTLLHQTLVNFMIKYINVQKPYKQRGRKKKGITAFWNYLLSLSQLRLKASWAPVTGQVLGRVQRKPDRDGRFTKAVQFEPTPPASQLFCNSVEQMWRVRPQPISLTLQASRRLSETHLWQEAQGGRCSLEKEGSGQEKLGTRVRSYNAGLVAPSSPEGSSCFQEQGSVTLPTLETWACN